MNIKLWYRTLDYYLIVPVIFLLAISFVLVHSASPVIAQRLSLPQDYFIRRHIIYIILSLVTLITFSFLNVKTIFNLSFAGFTLFIILMVAVIILGMEAKGAKRWLHIFKISIQPSEFMRPFFSVVIASILASRMKFRVHISIVVFLLIFALLLLQPDFSMSMLLTYSFVSQMLIACIPLLYFLCIAGIVTTGITTAYLCFPHIKQRVYNFLFFTQRDNFQVTKSLEAFKRGQLTGVGPGEGSVKTFLPDCHTDFVFSVLAEEFGLIMCLATLMLFGVISARLFYVAYRESELSNLLTILGISMQFITQFIINIGVTLSIFPTTGITLPLLSYGGSSLLSSSIAIGIMLSFSRNQAIALNIRERIALGRYIINQ
ncbi:FtsW/RodA/SpoVE family cell cycle protein [Wolbachia endosymbiont of Ctenocephalides felis wCfeJ]|uniref:FtsW/RodA/SpoVE family cell cycle protein n=1 Tax=Wolbachia endosymbiont of Ctenocephalides felis wCfeJ TaxID=2732594 RepID=UPI0014453094|nr:FtsW/RodA/SpoVE family cell cycle protein [Wolbachia endosymbiont of Ctenocephalides felis wCfeJ]WCR58293.1 MAG: putative peptidoglycan glycosyltransferase FtsW [Wolbachia endosymbiont of Ctenocephalides felis wCfeJ]